MLTFHIINSTRYSTVREFVAIVIFHIQAMVSGCNHPCCRTEDKFRKNTLLGSNRCSGRADCKPELVSVEWLFKKPRNLRCVK